MSLGANVRSVDAIKDFKITLINFAEDAKNALSSAEMEIRQVRNWLQRDQLSYWQSQVKKGMERVSMARTELHRRQLMASNSDAISDTDQKEALREAQRRLREAEEKVDRIKRWIPTLDHAISEYHSQAQPLGDRLSGSFVATLNVLDRMIGSLEEYLAMAPPTAPVAAAPRASTSSGPGEATSAATTAGTDGEAAGATSEDTAYVESAPAAAKPAAPSPAAAEALADAEAGPGPR
jgi:hypothetical protein